MKLRYFVIDQGGHVRRVAKAAINDLWRGTIRADALGCPNGTELRLVSVVCDRRLLPKKVYLLRLPLIQGRFTEASYLTLRVFSRPDCVTAREASDHHSSGWPADLVRQLAVALDVPVAGLNVPLGIGGPLLTAAALRVTLHQALRHLR